MKVKCSILNTCIFLSSFFFENQVYCSTDTLKNKDFLSAISAIDVPENQVIKENTEKKTYQIKIKNKFKDTISGQHKIKTAHLEAKSVEKIDIVNQFSSGSNLRINQSVVRDKKDSKRIAKSEDVFNSKTAAYLKEIESLRAMIESLKRDNLSLKTYQDKVPNINDNIRIFLLNQNKKLLLNLLTSSNKILDRVNKTDAINSSLISENTKLSSELKDLKEKSAINLSYIKNVSMKSLNNSVNATAYSNGYAIADNLKKSIKQQNKMGILMPSNFVIAGFNDNFNDRNMLPISIIKNNYAQLLTNMQNKENLSYEKGLKKLEEFTVDKGVIKRNQSIFFCKKIMGKGVWKTGDKGLLSISVSTLSGMKLRVQNNIPIIYSTDLPYILNQAMFLSEKNGTIDVYSFASDIYANGELPQGIQPYTLVTMRVTNRPTYN